MSDKIVRPRKVFAPVLLIILFLSVPGFSHGQADTGEDRRQASQWQAPPEAANRPNPVHADDDSLERGQTLFRQYCITCHGRSGRGDGPFSERLITEPPNLTKVPQEETDGELAWKIAKGKNPMPGWTNILKEEEIWDLVNYIRSINPASD